MVGKSDVERIKVMHGAGGTMMQKLIKEHILKYLSGSNAEVPLEYLDDSSVFNGIILKSDSYTVKPLFFPGGDIGRLAVAGSVNDILMVGGEPKALALGLIIEEGFRIDMLDRILRSISETSKEANVNVITGDTKVVEKGSIDQLMLNMSGIGLRHKFLDRNLDVVKQYYGDRVYRWILDRNIMPGDKIIINGYIGDHAIALLSVREGLGFQIDVVSDAMPLNRVVNEALRVGGVVAMKDPTRGGLSNLLNEWVDKGGYGIEIYEESIPIRDTVKNACEYLGLDPLMLGNEGKVVMAVVDEMAEDVLKAIRSQPGGENATIIGEVTDKHKYVVMRTVIGGYRVVPPPIGDPVPRIC